MAAFVVVAVLVAVGVAAYSSVHVVLFPRPGGGTDPLTHAAESPSAVRPTTKREPSPTPTSPAPPTKPPTPAKTGATAEPTPTVQWQTRVINATYVLHAGEGVQTNRIHLMMQTDGDLVLWNEHGDVVWSTRTHAPNADAVFQADGNFVVYSPNRATVWSSRTDGHDGSVLVLQADGKMSIRYGNSTLWSIG